MRKPISVREHTSARPESDNRDSGRERRRKVYNEKRDISQEFQKEGAPRHVRAGRIAVRLQRVPDSLFIKCPACGHDAWKWQENCPRCQAGLQA